MFCTRCNAPIRSTVGGWRDANDHKTCPDGGMHRARPAEPAQARALVGVDGFESGGPADRVCIVLRPVPNGERLYLELDAVSAREWGYAIARRAEAIIEAENDDAAAAASLHRVAPLGGD